MSSTKVRNRIAAVIIRDKRILLVKDERVSFFSIPGGVPKGGESPIETLSRELKEELGVRLLKASYFMSFKLTNQAYNVQQVDLVYLVVIKGKPQPRAEVSEIIWTLKNEITNNIIKTNPEFLSKLFPKLISDKLL